MALNEAKVILVTSVKGGTGKTSFSLNLAAQYHLLHKRALLLDLDLNSSAIAASLNSDGEKDIYKMIDDNNRFNSVDDYIVQYKENFSILAAPKDPRMSSKINSKYISVVLARLKLRYDVIVIDTNHILTDINLVAMDYSDQILYIITNDLVDLKNMRTMVSIYKDMDKTNYKVILNEAYNKNKNYFTIYDIKHMIDHNIDYIIPSSFYLKDFDKYIIDGKIPLLDKKVIVRNKKTVEIFEKMSFSFLKDNKKKVPHEIEKKVQKRKYERKSPRKVEK